MKVVGLWALSWHPAGQLYPRDQAFWAPCLCRNSPVLSRVLNTVTTAVSNVVSQLVEDAVSPLLLRPGGSRRHVRGSGEGPAEGSWLSFWGPCPAVRRTLGDQWEVLPPQLCQAGGGRQGSGPVICWHH